MKPSETSPHFVVDTSAAAHLSGDVSSASSEALGSILKNTVIVVPRFAWVRETPKTGEDLPDKPLKQTAASSARC